MTQILNERLGGPHAARDPTHAAPSGCATPGDGHEGRELLNIFIAEGEEIFALSSERRTPSCWAAPSCWPTSRSSRPTTRMRRPAATHRAARPAAGRRSTTRRRRGITVTIGGENPDPRLTEFTLVTAPTRRASCAGVIGVLGPTRMPYDKIIGLVEHTSRLVEGLLE